jgi:acylphosphatase
METKARTRVLISGRVQGVFFRMETKRFADQIGVTGWVRNRADGKVEAVFEGDESLLSQAVSWCKKGPPRSNVAGLDIFEEKYSGEFTSFTIVH